MNQTSNQTLNINNQHSGYESEFTLFLNELKKQKPELEEKQRQGRALLWDKDATSLADQERQQQATIKQNAYVYKS